MSSRDRVVIAGSTGSIGVQGLEVVRDNPERFEVVGLGANSSVAELAKQVVDFGVNRVAITDASRASELQSLVPSDVELFAGPDAMVRLIQQTPNDVVLNAVVGFAGLSVTIASLQQGNRLALANKESLVAAGDLVWKTISQTGAEMVPVDSEHGALHQCLRSETQGGAGDGRVVDKLLLTASGGPFRGKTLDELQGVRVEDALAHPNWAMGPKITIDSSTLFNKGLEVIEAHVLFGIDYDDIEVVVHPQSILHSAVVFTDGSVIGQMSKPDMRLPIGYALGYPQRLGVPYGAIDWTKLGHLSFEEPDRKTFRCLDLAFGAGRVGGVAPLWLNAANEVAVDAFLGGHMTWAGIPAIIEESLERCPGGDQESLEAVIESDSAARNVAREAVEKFGKK